MTTVKIIQGQLAANTDAELIDVIAKALAN